MLINFLSCARLNGFYSNTLQTTSFVILKIKKEGWPETLSNQLSDSISLYWGLHEWDRKITKKAVLQCPVEAIACSVDRCVRGDAHNKHRGAGLVALQGDLNETRGVDEWVPWNVCSVQRSPDEPTGSDVTVCVYVTQTHACRGRSAAMLLRCKQRGVYVRILWTWMKSNETVAHEALCAIHSNSPMMKTAFLTVMMLNFISCFRLV